MTVNTPVEGGTFTFGDDIPYTVTVTDPEDGTVNCYDVTVTFVLGHDTHGHAERARTAARACCTPSRTTSPTAATSSASIRRRYTDKGGGGGAPSLTTTGQHEIRQKHQEVEFVVNQSGTNTATNTDGDRRRRAPRQPRAGDWLQLNGPFNLININSITFRVADAAAGRTAGSPLAAIEIRQDSITGPILQTDNLVSTGGTATWTSQTFPISMSGTHELFLVFRTVTGGATGGNLFNLNWAEFIGPGIGSLANPPV